MNCVRKITEKEVVENIKKLGLKENYDFKKVNKVLEVITIGNNILRNKNEDVDVRKAEIKELIINMTNSLFEQNGCGIAAPQIGENFNLFIVNVEQIDGVEDLDEERKKYFTTLPLTVFVNPKIVEYSKETNLDYEGCLSVPGYTAVVQRSNKIVIEYINIYGEKCRNEYSGFVARAIMHEYDHLNGIIYTDIADMKTFSTNENLEIDNI